MFAWRTLSILVLLPGIAHAGDGGGAGALSLLAPAVAIGLALATRKVVPSLATGAVVGALVAAGGDPLRGLAHLGSALRGAVWDLDHFKISLFSVLVAAMVGLLTASGAMRGLVARIQRVARGRRGAAGATWLSGLVIFFDDYANCIVVGKAMGPLCDRTGVSRAKLAYLVDSTAAPIATVAVISTWVAFQVDQLEAALAGAGHGDTAAFGLFVQSIPYAFYAWLTLAFVGMVALTGRDFGPMWGEEQRARARPRPADTSELPLAPAWVALLPILALVLVTFSWMVWTGAKAVAGEAPVAAAFGAVPLFEMVGEAAAYDSMLLGSAVATGLAVLLLILRVGMAPRAVPAAAWSGIRPVLAALLVLYLAWTLGETIHATGAGAYIAGSLEGRVAPALLPTLTFVLAGLIAFATGTSFGTMIILIPMVVPLGLALTGDPTGHVVLATTAAVLSGAVLGDHASPISDTTILSSLGAEVDVVTHVRTQLPYALTTGLLAVLLGTLPAGYGVAPGWLILLGVLACFLVLRLFGRAPVEAS